MKIIRPIKNEKKEKTSVAAAAMSFVFFIPGEKLGWSASANSSIEELNNSEVSTPAMQIKTANHSNGDILKKKPRNTENPPSTNWI